MSIRDQYLLEKEYEKKCKDPNENKEECESLRKRLWEIQHKRK